MQNLKFIVSAVFFAFFMFEGVVFSQHPDQILVDQLSKRFETLNISHHDIEISARRGKVTLDGYVASSAEREMIEAATREEPSVKALTSHLSIKPTIETNSTTPHGCENLILPNLSHQGNVHVHCSGGVIKVSGVISDSDQAAIAQSLATQSPSSKIQFHTKRKPLLTDAELQRDVIQALTDEGLLPEASISIEVIQGVVVFHGSVANHRIIDAMLATSLNVKGVIDVKSSVTFAKQ